MIKLRVIAYCCLALAIVLIVKPLIDTTSPNPYKLSALLTSTSNQVVFNLPLSQNNATASNASEVKNQVLSFSHPPLSLGNNNNNTNHSQSVLVDPANNRKDKHGDVSKDISEIEYYFLAVVSMQRSSSTSFVFRVLNQISPCFVPMDEIYNKGPKRALELWEKYLGNTFEYDSSKGHSRGVKNQDLVTFAQRSAEQACLWEKERLQKEDGLDMEQLCHGKCIVGFKQFPEHLFDEQHAYLWNHLPNVTVTILERNVKDRWKSIWLAAQDGDWDTTGNAEHKAKLNRTIPPVTSSKKICKTRAFQKTPGFSGNAICHFEKTHISWYTLARTNNSDYIDVTFEESVTNNGSEAIHKVRSALEQKYGWDDASFTWNNDHSQ